MAAPLWDAPDAVRFIDGDGIAWRLVERGAAEVPGARGAACLICLSEKVVRRLWQYPRHWRTLAPAELEALMAAA